MLVSEAEPADELNFSGEHTTLNFDNLHGFELALVPERFSPCSTLATDIPLEITIAGDMDAEFFYSSWVRRNILRVTKLLGVTFEGYVCRIRKKNA